MAIEKTDKIHVIDVSIVGIAALLQNKFVEGLGKPDPNDSDKKIAEKVLYLDVKGIVVQPAEHIEAAMAKAGVQFKMKGQGKKTYKDFVKSGVFITPELIPHDKQKWVVDKRRVVIGKASIMRRRPMFTGWSLKFVIDVINPEIDLEVLRKILDYAGKFIGIGDQRPKYGRFTVTDWKIRK